MLFTMTKTTSINLRISPEFRDDIERLAAYHGLTMSSYAHSLLVKAVRREKESEPEAFAITPKPTRGIKAAEIHLQPQKGKVVAHIGPAVDPKAEVRKMVSGDQIDEMAKRLKPRKRKTG